jgi:hypothetical protein
MLYSTKRDGVPDESVPASDRLSLGQFMILIAGAALGLGLLPLGSAVRFPVFGPSGISLQGLVIALYGTVSGVTMAALTQDILSLNRARPRHPPVYVTAVKRAHRRRE